MSERVAAKSFEMVRTIGLALPDVEATTKYDGSPVLKVGGCFMAGLATHPTAEPDTLVVRVGFDEREWLLEDAPDTYYLTDHYRRYPIVLARLSGLDRDALRDLLSVSWRLTCAKAGRRGRSARHTSIPGMTVRTASLVVAVLLSTMADRATAQETTDEGDGTEAQFEPYARFQAHLAGIGGEAEVQDNPSWVGVRFSTGNRVKFLAHGEWSINLIESDTLLSPGDATGGDFLTAERDEVPVLGNRLGYVGVDFGAGGRLLLGKQHAAHYDIANYTTDRLTAFGGGVATLAYPAGTDGGQTGTGRADQTFAYRNAMGILQVTGQLQFQNTTNNAFLDGYGGSARVTVLPGLELGVSGTKVIVSDEAIDRIPGLDGDPRYAAVGAKYTSEVVEVGGVFAAQENGDLTGFALPDMVADNPEIALVGFDAKGVELYGQVNVGSVSVVGGWANYDPDVDVEPLIGRDFRVRYYVVGAWFHTTKNTYAYAEVKAEDSIDATGAPVDNAFAVGFRYNFSRPFTYQP